MLRLFKPSGLLLAKISDSSINVNRTVGLTCCLAASTGTVYAGVERTVTVLEFYKTCTFEIGFLALENITSDFGS